jgi:hypothetical protein
MRLVRSTFPVTCLFLLGVSAPRTARGGEGKLPPPPAHRISVNQVKNIEIGGDMRRRMDAIIDWEIKGRQACGFNDRWILNDLEHTLPDPRTSEDFTGDVWGAYIETMSVLARITGKRYPEVDQIVEGALGHQRPDGSFWNVVPEEKDLSMVVSDNRVWGWQRALIGFVEYYRTSQDERVLRAATQLGDFLLKRYDQSRTVARGSNMARTMRGSALYPPSSYWSAVSQGFLGLYQITHEKKYLDAATEVADHVAGELLDVENTTDCLTWHGVMLLYEQTGKADYFHKVQKNVDAVMQMMKVLGDTPHLWHWPKSNEACSLADSITLNCDLWRATLHPRYMDAVERIAYNAFCASIYPQTGCGRYSYGHRVTGGGRHADPQEETGIRDCFVQVYKGGGGEACCNWHVPVAFRDIAGHIFAKGDKPDVYVNLFIPSRTEFAVGEASDQIKVRVKQETDYPHGEDVIIRVAADSPVTFPLHVRIPYWCNGATVALNSDVPIAAAAGHYVKLDRQWGRDIIHLRLPMPMRIESADVPWGQPANPSHGTVDRAVLLKGPLVLVLCGDNNPNMAPLWDEAHLAGIRPALVVPTGGESFALPQDEREIDKNRPFTYRNSDYVGIWEIPDSAVRGGPLRVKGHLTPFAEVTGSRRASFVQFTFPVRAIHAAQYASQYGSLLESSAFEMTAPYRSLLKDASTPKTWVPWLTECISRDKYSYDAVLAAQRLGRSSDSAALKPLNQCLRTDNILLQRTAVEAVGQLGKSDEQTVSSLREIAQKTPELRAAVQETLTRLGHKIAAVSDGTNVSWIQGPANVREYVLKRSLKIDRQDVEKMDIRVCSWDVYEVLLNGKIAGVKPTWAHAKFLDLTPLLKPGENELLIRVIRLQKLPAEFVKTWTLGAGSLPPGVIAKLRVERRDHSEEAIYTDTSWMAAAVPVAPAGGDWINSAAGFAWTPCATKPHTGGNPFSYGYKGD